MGGGNEKISIKREISMGEEEENTNTKKLKDKVINTKGECLLKIIEERGWYISNENIKQDGRGIIKCTVLRGITVIDSGVINRRNLK